MTGAGTGSGRSLELVLPPVPGGRSELAGSPPVLALDLGGTLTRAAVVRNDGTLQGRVSVPTPVSDGADVVIASCVALLERALAAGSGGGAPSSARPVAIGVSAPGPLDPWTGTMVDPPNLGPTFRDIPLGERLEAALGMPCVVDRDTNVAALGEAVFGAAVGCRDFLYLTISTGIGGAVVTGGRLMLGPDGMAGELGHVTVDMAGEKCGCGGRGHLEAIASGIAIARAASLAGHPWRSAREVAKAADGGNTHARAIMDRAAHAFAAACVSFVDIFDPDAIIVGGGVARGQGERWLGAARSLVAEAAFARPRARVRISVGGLGDDVSLVGCFVLATQRAADARWRGGRAVPTGGGTAPV